MSGTKRELYFALCKKMCIKSWIFSFKGPEPRVNEHNLTDQNHGWGLCTVLLAALAKRF